MSETCRVIINQVKQKLHLVGYLLTRYFKDARYHERKKENQFSYSTSPLNMGGPSGCVKDSRLKIRCADNFRMGLPKIGWGCGLIWLSIGTGSGIVNTITNLRVT